jgi:ketosteroid isomerase-like protein
MHTVTLPRPPGPAQDLEALTALNLAYVRGVDDANVRWFDEHLASDFMNSNPDGSIVDRSAFLAQIGRGASVSDIQAHDVLIRIVGDVAIIHARTTYTMRAGERGQGRYTDIWSRRDSRWLCVAAHVTRC